jgi:hypothetical protein
MQADRTHKYRAAICPNIFDAFSDTDFLLPLVLGNLLSENLWALSIRIQQKIAERRANNEVAQIDNEDSLEFVRAIQQQLDRQFKHLHPNEVATIYGELDLSDERIRIGKVSVDRTLDLIEANFKQRMSDDSPAAQALSLLLERIKQDRFPAFFYTNFDVVKANRGLLGRRSSAPLGLTSCLDEVAIFAALAMTMPEQSISNVVGLASASHYTAFGWTNLGEPWWLYGKNRLLSSSDWMTIVKEDYEGDHQKAFNHYLKELQCIVSVAGTFDLLSGRSEITLEHRSEIVQKMDQFFGVRLTQLSSGLERSITQLAESPLAPYLRNLMGTQSIQECRDQLLLSQRTECLQALYSYRSLDVQNLRPYVEVACHQTYCKAVGSTLTSFDEALDVIRALPGTESIFKNRNRIAMPDETLRLKTGTDRDKALLLHALLFHCRQAASIMDSFVTILTDIDSFVCSDARCVSITTLSDAPRPTRGIVGVFQR